MKKLNNIMIYILAVFWIIPLIWVVITAFKPANMATKLSLNFNFTLENFIKVWEAVPFKIYYINTIIIVFGILIVQLTTATLAAYAFARMKFKFRDLIFLLILIQIIIPNDILLFPNCNTLGNLSLVDKKLGIMIPYFATAFGIFLLRQTFKTIPYEFEEAARLDGCNIFQILWNIYIPLAKPTYIAFSLISISYHWNNFLWPLIVTNSDANRPLTVGLAIFATTFETGAQWSEVSAATSLVIFPLIILFFAFQKHFIKSFMHSGLK